MKVPPGSNLKLNQKFSNNTQSNGTIEPLGQGVAHARRQRAFLARSLSHDDFYDFAIALSLSNEQIAE